MCWRYRWRVDGRCDHPDHRREVSGARAFTHARVHGVSQSSVARRPAQVMASTAQDEGMLALGKNAAQWVMSPRIIQATPPSNWMARTALCVPQQEPVRRTGERDPADR